MHRLTPTIQTYAWGSTTELPERLGVDATGGPMAEAWFGAHPNAPSVLHLPDGGRTLTGALADDPVSTLGDDVTGRFGPTLPYLLKVIAAQSPLSLQVHPQKERAVGGYVREDAVGIPLDAPERSFRDRNHKPELLYALTRFEAMCGFRAPRRLSELLDGLETRIAEQLRGILRAQPSVGGIETAFTWLLRPDSRPSAGDVGEFAAACAARLANGSPSPRADRTVVRLQEAYPGDPGVVTSLLLNPVTLHPGEALFVPAGGVHAYLAGTGVEIMASSDNVLRAGLTPKHVDVEELLRNVDYVAAPPIRIAPERFHGATKVFYAPVDDFELSVTEVVDGASHPLPGRGPRILLCLDGTVTAATADDGELELTRGQAAFVPAVDGALTLRGAGTLVQADVP